MKAIVIRDQGKSFRLEPTELPDPLPSRGEVRVRIRAAGVNRADLLQMRGSYPAPLGCPSDIPGLEFAGEVDAAGEGVTDFQIGERVFGIAGGGTYAERIVVHAGTVATIPRGLSFIEAAAVPEAFITAYDAMVLQGNLGLGQTVLVHAVGSGVGTAARALAHAVGAHPLGTARTASKLERASVDGVVVADGTFADAILEKTSGKGVDVVLDLVGGAYFAENLRAVAPRGTIVVVGLVGGAAASIDLALLLKKRVTVRGTVLRSRPLEEKIAATRLLAERIAPLLETRVLAPIVARVFDLDDAKSAIDSIARNDVFGKVVLSV